MCLFCGRLQGRIVPNINIPRTAVNLCASLLAFCSSWLRQRRHWQSPTGRWRHSATIGLQSKDGSGLKPERAAPTHSNQHNSKADRKTINHKVFEPGMTGWKRDLQAF